MFLTAQDRKVASLRTHLTSAPELPPNLPWLTVESPPPPSKRDREAIPLPQGCPKLCRNKLIPRSIAPRKPRRSLSRPGGRARQDPAEAEADSSSRRPRLTRRNRARIPMRELRGNWCPSEAREEDRAVCKGRERKTA